jgi:hypothetical protein
VRLIDRLSRRFDAAGGWEGNASGAAIFTTTYGSPDREAILPNLTAFANEAYSGNSIVFGAILARLSLFSQARFAYQDLGDEHLWGTDVTDGRRATGLRKLERPWPNGTTGELLARMIQDADLAGNAYIWDNGDHLVRLRPDQVTIVSKEMTDPMGRTYREVIGYYWDPKAGFGQPSKQAQYYDVSEVAHWSPIPDPLANFRGMSWMTPVVREIRADSAMAATYSNYKQAMRRFSDITMWQLWPSVCACLSTIIDVPSGSRLWMRTSDIPALQEDEKERADATLVKANAVAALTRFGYDPKTVILAVQSGDFSLLAHSGLAIDIVTEVPKAAPAPLVLAPPTAAEQKTGTAVQPTTKQVPAGVNGSKPAGTGGNDGGL